MLKCALKRLTQVLLAKHKLHTIKVQREHLKFVLFRNYLNIFQATEVTEPTSTPSVEDAKVPNHLDPLKDLKETSLVNTVISRPGNSRYILHKELSDLSMQF